MNKASQRQARYDAKATTRVALKLNNNTDADVIEWLDKQSSKQGSVKELIRREIMKEQIKGIKAIYDYTGCDVDSWEHDYNNGYLTMNVGRDGTDYLWYVDENNNVAYNTATYELITNEDSIDGLLG